MKSIKIYTLAILVTVFFVSSALFAKEKKQSFSGKDHVRIKLVLSDCEISGSADDKVYVTVNYTYDDQDYEISFKEKSHRLVLSEDYLDDDPDGDAKWTIKVPKGTEIDFESATGDVRIDNLDEVTIEASSGTGCLHVENTNGELELNSGTGDVTLVDCEGEFDLNSGTGDVSIEKAEGIFDLNSGTGDVLAEKITIVEEAELNSGTGEVEVISPMGEDFELSINSGTDDAILDMSGVPIQGYFEFTVHSRRGRIVCPVKFDKVEEYEENDSGYTKKSFTKGKDTPKYFISSGTGKAKLVK